VGVDVVDVDGAEAGVGDRQADRPRRLGPFGLGGGLQTVGGQTLAPAWKSQLSTHACCAQKTTTMYANQLI